jgi:hypothetical protein
MDCTHPFLGSHGIASRDGFGGVCSVGGGNWVSGVDGAQGKGRDHRGESIGGSIDGSISRSMSGRCREAWAIWLRGLPWGLGSVSGKTPVILEIMAEKKEHA